MATPKTYTVKKGDTLSGILKSRGLLNKMSEIASLSGIKNPDLIRPGERIVLPDTDASGNLKYEEPKVNTVTVKSGDTMSGLFGSAYNQVAAYNDIENPNKIRVGQKIKVPSFMAGGGSNNSSVQPKPTMPGTATPTKPKPTTPATPATPTPTPPNNNTPTNSKNDFEFIDGQYVPENMFVEGPKSKNFYESYKPSLLNELYNIEDQRNYGKVAPKFKNLDEGNKWIDENSIDLENRDEDYAAARKYTDKTYKNLVDEGIIDNVTFEEIKKMESLLPDVMYGFPMNYMSNKDLNKMNYEALDMGFKFFGEGRVNNDKSNELTSGGMPYPSRKLKDIKADLVINKLAGIKGQSKEVNEQLERLYDMSRLFKQVQYDVKNLPNNK